MPPPRTAPCTPPVIGRGAAGRRGRRPRRRSASTRHRNPRTARCRRRPTVRRGPAGRRRDRLRGTCRQVILARHEQPPRVVGVDGPDDPAVRQPGRHTGDDVQPGRVLLVSQHARRAGLRVDGQQLHPALVPGLHDDQRRAGIPADGGEVGEGGGVPAHRNRATAGMDDQQFDDGVRRAGRRVPELGRPPRRIRGVADVPAVDAGVVDARDQQAAAVRRPPEPPLPAHLLGGDELSEPVGDVLGPAWSDEFGVGAAVQVGDPQRAVAHVGDPPARRIGPRVDGGERAPIVRGPGPLASGRSCRPHRRSRRRPS